MRARARERKDNLHAFNDRLTDFGSRDSEIKRKIPACQTQGGQARRGPPVPVRAGCGYGNVFYKINTMVFLYFQYPAANDGR